MKKLELESIINHAFMLGRAYESVEKERKSYGDEFEYFKKATLKKLKCPKKK